jgi:integrase
MSIVIDPKPKIRLVIRDSKPKTEVMPNNISGDIIPHIATVPQIIAAQKIQSNRRSRNTLRAYEYDWGLFLTYCRSLVPRPEIWNLDQNHVWFHLQDMKEKGLKHSTIERRLAGIIHHLPILDIDAPLARPLETCSIRSQMEGLRRTISTRKEGQQPILMEKLHQMIEAVGWTDTSRQLQDRTLLLITWHACMRREESCSLMWDDIEEKEILDGKGQKSKGLLIHIRKSKTDQTQKGMDKAIVSRNDVYCPVKHLMAWKARLEGKGSVWRTINRSDKITEKPLTVDAFYHRMKKYTNPVEGLDSGRCSPHSLRSGFITQCGNNNVPLILIQQQSGHTNPTSVSAYLRNEDKFKQNAGHYL